MAAQVDLNADGRPQQGDTALLQDPVAQELLVSREWARLAYTWRDGTPRVVPVAFHWNGTEMVVGTPSHAAKVAALQEHPRVAVTIDTSSFPMHVLMLRGEATIELLDDLAPEYEEATRRYMGPGADAWLAGLRGRPMARIAVVPDWVAVLDFESRFPSALAR